MTAGGSIVCHAGAGPSISVVTILSRQNILKMAQACLPAGREAMVWFLVSRYKTWIYLGTATGVRVEWYEGHDIENRRFKNRDKQMPFIVRVSISGQI